MAADIRARTPQQQENPAWDEFVENHPHGTPFHLTPWRQCIEATLGYHASVGTRHAINELGQRPGRHVLGMVEYTVGGFAYLDLPSLVAMGVLHKVLVRAAAYLAEQGEGAGEEATAPEMEPLEEGSAYAG